jgi:RNA polymerase sigma factor (sigma-70 family)
MASDNKELRKKLDEAIDLLDKPDKVKAIIRSVIMVNLDHARVEHFLALADLHQPADYVNRVAELYESQHRYVNSMRQGSDDIWHPLYEKMQRWAYGYLRRCNFFPGQDTFELAISYAGEAGGNMVKAHYPFDVANFDAWAMELVKNACRKNMKRAVNQNRIPENLLATLEDDIQYPDELYRGVEQLVEDGYDLQMILSHLDERERIVILARLNGIKPQEVAAQLDTTTNNVYKIGHDVIQKMRKNFQE